MSERCIVGSRGSDLALWQSRWVMARLVAKTELVVITTQGDVTLDRDLSGMAGKGFFTKEIEEALYARTIDLAVHSLKDLPTRSPEGLVVAAIPERAAVADLLLVHPDWHDASLPFPVREGGTVGASSLRRQAFVRSAGRTPASLRGNVPTRVRKCREGHYAAIVLAEAGLSRLALDLGGLHAYRLDASKWLPAPGQGALGIETREGDAAVALAQRLDHMPTREAVEAERGLLARFEGGCHLPLGVLVSRRGEILRMESMLSPSEGRLVSCIVEGSDGAELVERAHAELTRRIQAGEWTSLAGEKLCTPVAAWS